MFHLNTVIMKDLLFKKILLVPVLMTGVFALFLSSCDKDKDDDSDGKSLAVTVNFSGTKVPSAGEQLMVVLVYSPLSEVDMENDGPDDILLHTLTANDITSGVTLTFTNIDPAKAEVYVAAFVDSDGDGSPGPGELLECYQDVSALDALTGKANATNVAGKKAITINLDQILTMPSLAVTVNFTGTKPEVGKELMVVLVYSPFSEVDMENDGPDKLLSHFLTGNDITNGVTLTFEDINPFAEEVYVAAIVDFDGDGSPGPGDLIECYQDKNALDILSGKAEATNVAGETAITINLDEIMTGPSLDVTVKFTGDLIPEVGDFLSVFVFYTKISELDLDGDVGPDFYVSVALTQPHIDNGVTVKLDEIDLDKPEIYVGATVDIDKNEGPTPGDLAEFFEDVDLLDAALDVARPENCHGLNSVVINLDQILTMPSLAVTVNFTGTTIPEAGNEMQMVLFYSSLSEFNPETDDPDDVLSHTLTPGDITGGITLTFTDINPFAEEIYVAVLVDSDGDGSPGNGELAEFYKDVSVFDVLTGQANATNVAGKTAITINLDLVLEMP